MMLVVVIVVLVLVGVWIVIVVVGCNAGSVHGDGEDWIIETWSDQVWIRPQDGDDVIDVVTRIGVELCR